MSQAVRCVAAGFSGANNTHRRTTDRNKPVRTHVFLIRLEHATRPIDSGFYTTYNLNTDRRCLTAFYGRDVAEAKARRLKSEADKPRSNVVPFSRRHEKKPTGAFRSAPRFKVEQMDLNHLVRDCSTSALDLTVHEGILPDKRCDLHMTAYTECCDEIYMALEETFMNSQLQR